MSPDTTKEQVKLTLDLQALSALNELTTPRKRGEFVGQLILEAHRNSFRNKQSKLAANLRMMAAQIESESA